MRERLRSLVDSHLTNDLDGDLPFGDLRLSEYTRTSGPKNRCYYQSGICGIALGLRIGDIRRGVSNIADDFIRYTDSVQPPQGSPAAHSHAQQLELDLGCGLGPLRWELDPALLFPDR